MVRRVGREDMVDRKRLLIANWKLNHTRQSAGAFVDKVMGKTDHPSLIPAIAPVAPMLDFLGRALDGCNILLAAQNVFYEEKGAFTGEWSASHLAELGVRYCIVGHSERRKIFFESDEDVKKKARACVDEGIIPIVCVGETAHQRQQDQTTEVVTSQVAAVLGANGKNIGAGPVVFAYEPIWAIGTGNAASPQEAQRIHGLIRERIAQTVHDDFAQNMQILYGGSVTSENISDFVAMPDVDGALVGGASLQADSFLSMVAKLGADS